MLAGDRLHPTVIVFTSLRLNAYIKNPSMIIWSVFIAMLVVPMRVVCSKQTAR